LEEVIASIDFPLPLSTSDSSFCWEVFLFKIAIFWEVMYEMNCVIIEVISRFKIFFDSFFLFVLDFFSV